MTVAKETFSVTVVQIDPKQIMKPKNYKRKIPFMIPSKTNKVGVSDLKKNKAPATFQKSLRVTLIIGQMFSLLPVEGVCSTSPIDVRFVWWSFKFTYLILSLIGQFFITFMCLYKILHSTSSLNGTTPLIFYGTTCITTTLFLRVALRWPDLIRHIAHVEDQDSYYDRTLTLKCNATCGGVLFLALVEHLLSLLSAYTGAMVCQSEDMTHESFVKHFYPWVFNYLPYSFGLGILTQFLHFQSTFIWNFSDLFVICISYYLTSRLNYVNKQLLNAQGKYLPEVFWRTVREEYCRAAQLVRRVDDVINGVIFISFANNLFFICLQLFNSLEDGIKGNGECSSRGKGKPSILGGYEAASYFFFSLVFLIARSVTVSLIASQVNSASNVPASVLYDVPSPVYCVEVQRFLDQVNGDNIALSGLQFFSVTRGLLLTVAGTIVTYELVMFQFNSQPQSSKISPTSPTLSFYNNTIIPIL
ncbi:gustatory receptor for sugar taste 64f-like isoform X1 [Vanessa atalanta]|uniref:gustatory receptor for sugar taste 64f-like isoform X1 n=1 Tax=Vanessa atalanta TaxID=42275 RepID=UPI001FCDEAB5|nr:gustatory receptor for sugar taste 64f-like isoform X1 [Vanessa atalanta]